MAYRLKDRNKQIPNGLRFLQPETNWKPARFASFTVIVNSLINHRKSNPALVAQKKWATDFDTVANEVDAFNALICARHGWTDYISDGSGVAPPPKTQALLQRERSEVSAAAGKAKKIWSGIKTLNDWIDSGHPPVKQELANMRAVTCNGCPKNGKGDFTSWFTRPAAEAIGRQIQKLTSMKLNTPHSANLNICDVCLCPLKLKVHTPLEFIKAHLSAEVLAELRKVPGCWLPKELDA